MKIIAADIASVSDYTAAAVLAVTDEYPRCYYLSALDRWREKYTITGERLAGLARRHPDAALVIDATGVGRPVLDALRDALPGRAVYGITLTGGRSVNRGQAAGDVTVPKADLVGALQVLLQSRRLSWPRELPLIRELQGEFAAFQPKITLALHQTYGGKGEHDDLVLAIGLGCWLGEHLPAPLADVEGLVLGPIPESRSEPQSGWEAIRADYPNVFL